MRITKVEYLSDYQLKLTFGNKEVRIVDLSEKIHHAKGIFSPLKEIEYFKKVAVDDCQLSIFWPNGADICPDVLYEMGKPVLAQKKQARKSAQIKRRQRRSLKNPR